MIGITKEKSKSNDNLRIKKEPIHQWVKMRYNGYCQTIKMIMRDMKKELKKFKLNLKEVKVEGLARER